MLLTLEASVWMTVNSFWRSEPVLPCGEDRLHIFKTDINQRSHISFPHFRLPFNATKRTNMAFMRISAISKPNDSMSVINIDVEDKTTSCQSIRQNPPKLEGFGKPGKARELELSQNNETPSRKPSRKKEVEVMGICFSPAARKIEFQLNPLFIREMTLISGQSCDTLYSAHVTVLIRLFCGKSNPITRSLGRFFISSVLKWRSICYC